MFKADETLDFHNKQIGKPMVFACYHHDTKILCKTATIALGEKCENAKQSCAYILTSPLGHVYTNACPNGLHCVKLYGDTNYDDIDWNAEVDFIRASTLMPSNKHVKDLRKWLRLYFSEPVRCEQEVELSFCGLEDYGDFNSGVWMAIKRTCPPGELMSYSELALRSGNSAGASKVVGYAINKNPYMLVVGDHRVVKASGEIWCENESQRNKLRRLLVKYEIESTGQTLDEALLKVKERNDAAKGTRRRGATKKSAPKSETNKAKPKVKKEGKATKATAKGRARKKVKQESSDDSKSVSEQSFDDD